MSQIKCAVIGLGNIGLKCEDDPCRLKPASHCGSYVFHKDTTLDIMVDINPTNLELAHNKFPNVKCSNNINDVLNGNFDIVSVSTNPESHCDLVCSLAGHCKLIICEKPIALSIDEAQKMIDVCDHYNTKLVINHHRRFDKMIFSLKETLFNEIGKISCVSCFYTNGLFTNGSHIIDLLVFLFGEVKSVIPKKVNRSCHSNDFNADILFEFNDMHASMQALEVSNMNIFDMKFFGERGIALLTQFSRRLEITPRRVCSLFSGYYEPDYDIKKIQISESIPMYDMVDHAVECVNGRSKIMCSGRDAIENLRIINKIISVLEKN